MNRKYEVDEPDAPAGSAKLTPQDVRAAAETGVQTGLRRGVRGALYGDDVFISYSRRDGARYAVGLADALTEKRLSVYMDKLGTEPNADLPDSLKRTIRNCKLFVLVGSPLAAQSDFVQKEIEEFRKMRGTIVPIDFDGEMPRARWYKLVEGVAVESEDSPDALTKGEPSDEVIARILKSFTYKRRNDRLRRTAAGISLLLVALIVAAVAAGVYARGQFNQAIEERKKADDARKEARDAQKVADEQKDLAGKAKKAAEEATTKATLEAERAKKVGEEAERQADLARAKTLEARKQTEIARLKTEEAVKQTKRAEAERNNADAQMLAAHSRSQLTTDPESSVLLAREAVNMLGTRGLDRNPQVEDALRKALAASSVRSAASLRVEEAGGGPPAGLKDVAFSDDRKLLVTADGLTVRVRDAKSGKVEAELRAARTAGFSPDGNLVLVTRTTAEGDEKLAVWDWKSEARRNVPVELKRAGDEIAMHFPQFDPDSKTVITRDLDGVARVRDARTGEILPASLPDEKIIQAGFLPRRGFTYVKAIGKKVGDTEAGYVVRIRGADGKLVSELSHPAGIRLVAFDSSGSRAATHDAYVENTVCVWDVDTGKMIGELKGHDRDKYVNSIEFSHDGQLVLTASTDGTARVWKAEGGEQLVALRGHVGNVGRAAFSPDGAYVVTAGSDDGTAKVWDAQTGRLLVNLLGHTEGVRIVAFDPADGRSLLTASGDDTWRWWDLNVGYGGVTRLTSDVVFIKTIGSVRWAEFGPDGKSVQTIGLKARKWDAATGVVLKEFEGFYNGATNSKIDGIVALSPDESLALIRGGYRAFKIVDATTSREVSVLRTDVEQTGDGVLFDDGGRVLAALGADAARVFDVKTGEKLAELKRVRELSPSDSSKYLSAAFSRGDGALLALIVEGAVEVYDTKTWDKKFVLPTSGKTYSVAFSPDNRRIVTGGSEAAIWDVSGGQEAKNILPLKSGGGPGRVVLSAAFSPDGRHVATSNEDGTVDVWDSISGRRVSVLDAGGRPAQRVRFNRDGTFLLAAGDKQGVYIFSREMYLPLGELLKLIPDHTSGRPLSEFERKRFFPAAPKE